MLTPGIKSAKFQIVAGNIIMYVQSRGVLSLNLVRRTLQLQKALTFYDQVS